MGGRTLISNGGRFNEGGRDPNVFRRSPRDIFQDIGRRRPCSVILWSYIISKVSREGCNEYGPMKETLGDECESREMGLNADIIVPSCDSCTESVVALVELACSTKLLLIMSEPRMVEVGGAGLSTGGPWRSSVMTMDTVGRGGFFQEGPGGNDCFCSSLSAYLA